MGREIRRVRNDWQHPKDARGRYIPLFDDIVEARKWRDPTHPYYDSECADPPDPADYMPEWTEAEKTHIQMYETCSEGTPISPVMETPEELARWLADNRASAFGSMTATYEEWLEVCIGGFAPSACLVGGQVISGVKCMAHSEGRK